MYTWLWVIHFTSAYLIKYLWLLFFLTAVTSCILSPELLAEMQSSRSDVGRVVFRIQAKSFSNETKLKFLSTLYGNHFHPSYLHSPQQYRYIGNCESTFWLQQMTLQDTTAEKSVLEKACSMIPRVLLVSHGSCTLLQGIWKQKGKARMSSCCACHHK